MADLFDENGELLDLADPLAKQSALAATVRRTPALATPSTGIDAPRQAITTRTSYSTGGTPSGTAAQLLAQINERIGKRPDAEPLMEYARQRREQANQNMVLGLTLGAKGGSAFAPAAQHVLTQALKESGDYEIPGGWGTVTQKGVVWNPEKQEQADPQKLVTLYGIQERAESQRQYRSETQAQRDAQQAQRQDQQRWRFEDQARSHFDQVTKDTRDVLNMGRALSTLPPDGRLTPVQQQSLIIMLNKFQDPGSVVREGEFNRVAEAQGLLQKWGNIPAKIVSGQPMPPALVRDIRAVLGLYTTAAENTMRSTGKDYYENAEKRGLDPTQVVTDPRWHPQRGGRPGASSDLGRGTAESPITVRPRGAAAPQGNVVEVPY